MRATEEQHNARKREMMEKCFECYAENGLTGTGIKALAKACGCTTGNLYSYFSSVDELIIESTAYCMEKVEDDFMEMALYRVCQATGAEDRYSVHGHHSADFYLRPRLCALCDVRGRILPEIPDGGLKAGSRPVRG